MRRNGSEDGGGSHKGTVHSSGESIGDDMIDYMENVMQSNLDSGDETPNAEVSHTHPCSRSTHALRSNPKSFMPVSCHLLPEWS